MKKIYLVNIIMLVWAASFVCSCSSTITTTQQSITTAVTIPTYSTYTMNLTHDNNPGSTPIYLHSNTILHLIWYTDDQAKVALDVVTPSGRIFGLDSNNNFTENYGTDSNGGAKNFSPADLGS